MTDLQARIEDIIWTELERQWEGERFGPYVSRRDGVIDGRVDMGPVAAAIVAELALDTETKNLPVFVEDVPRRPIENFVFADGQEHYERHVEFISHSHYTSPWYGAECPDCQDEFGIHDRRHAEIVAESAGEIP